MSLFKKKESKEACCCGGECSAEDMAKAEAVKGEGARIKILGSGCANCKALEKGTQEALSELGKDLPIDHVTDFAQIAAYGVMTTPALVIDEKVVSYGKVLKKDEIKEILKKTIE